MESLIKNFLLINKKVLKGKIKLTDETQKIIPRSLWRVKFPPPKEDILTCNGSCKKILMSIKSRRSITLLMFVIIIISLIIHVKFKI